MTNTNIRQFIDKYQLNVGGVEFWTPYPFEELTLDQRREYSGKQPKAIPFKGRGAPEDIKKHLLNKLREVKEAPETPEEYRKFMASINLGVECSGFAYYVLDQYLKANHKKELKNHLYKTKRELLDIYDHPNLTPPKELKRSTVEAYPECVSLAQIQADWGNNPRYVIDATVFTNDCSTVPVEIKGLKEADLIETMGYGGIGHPLIIVEVKENKIIYAHSGGRHGREDYFGGVEYNEIKITDPALPIEKQGWKDGYFLKTHKFERDALRRLKILA